jgi:uncharacterized protein (DUF983 family)
MADIMLKEDKEEKPKAEEKEQNPMVAECDRCRERKVIDAMTDTHIFCAPCWLEYKQEMAEMEAKA